MTHDRKLPIRLQHAPATAHGPLADAVARGVPPPASLYIHVPFCTHKCHYCDFYSLAGAEDRVDAFAQRLCRELTAIAGMWSDRARLRTIFVGGGTPTLMPGNAWERVLETLGEVFELTGLEEFTVESNPETADPALLGVLAAGGVNRMSFGAQSFDRTLLDRLERTHRPEAVARAIDAARGAGIDNVNVDLIFAIPGQTVAGVHADVARAVALLPAHVSCYNLTYEPNTPMTKRLARGEFEPIGETDEIAMHEAVHDALGGAGFHAYEVSNFARPGLECRHNLAYWRQEDWLAAGPSASAHVGGHRWKNVPRLGEYLGSGSPAGHATIVDHEPPDDRRAWRERVMTGLRLREGLDGGAITSDARAVDNDAGDRLEREAARWIESGHLVAERGRWRLTRSGLLLADGIAGALMRVLL